MALEKIKDSRMTTEEARGLYSELLKKLHNTYDSSSMYRSTPFYLPEGETLKFEGKNYIPYCVECFFDYSLESVVLSCRCKTVAGESGCPGANDLSVIVHPEKACSHQALKTLLRFSSSEAQREFTLKDMKSFAECFVDNLAKDNPISFKLQDPYYDIPRMECSTSSKNSVKTRNSGRLNFSMEVNGLPHFGSLAYSVNKCKNGFQINSSSLKMVVFGNIRIDVSELLSPKQKVLMLEGLLKSNPPKVYFDSTLMSVTSFDRKNILKSGKSVSVLKKLLPGL